MPNPSPRIVQDRIKAILDTMTDWTWWIDRSDAEPFEESERPAGSIRIPTISIQHSPDGIWQHMLVATVQFDFQSSGETALTIDAVNQKAIAAAIALLMDDPTLGGRLHELEPRDISSVEEDGADVGTAILTMEAMWMCPRGDLFTIVGIGGQTFTD